MKFIKIPVFEIRFSKEKIQKVFRKRDPDEPDWEAMGIENPHNDDFTEGFIEATDDDYVIKERRINAELIEDYSDSDITPKGFPATFINYGGNTCFMKGTAEELDNMLKQLDIIIV